MSVTRYASSCASRPATRARRPGSRTGGQPAALAACARLRARTSDGSTVLRARRAELGSPLSTASSASTIYPPLEAASGNRPIAGPNFRRRGPTRQRDLPLIVTLYFKWRLRDNCPATGAYRRRSLVNLPSFACHTPDRASVPSGKVPAHARTLEPLRHRARANSASSATLLATLTGCATRGTRRRGSGRTS